MSIEATIYNALKALVGDRVFPDVAPAKTQTPYITFQQIGGAAYNYIEGGAVDARNARVQVNVWAGTRLEASTIGNAAENALRNVPGTEVLDAGTSIYEEETALRGRMQDFSLTY